MKLTWLRTFFTLVLISGFFTHAQAADDRGWFSSIGSLNLGSGKTLSPGDTVEFLGIIDVERIISPSGKLATFRFESQIFNADAALFYKVDLENNFEILPVIGRDDGETAALCTTLRVANSGRNIDLKESDLASHLQVKHQGQLLSAFNVKKPINTDSYSRNSTDFCVAGLQYSNQYKVTLLKGFKAGQNLQYTLDQDLVFVANTPERTPKIELEPAQNILAPRFGATIPVKTTNIEEFEVSLYRIDLRTVASFSDLFKSLNDYESDAVERFWGEHLGTRKVSLDGEVNETLSFNLDLQPLLYDIEPGMFVAVFNSKDFDLLKYENRPTQWFMISDIAVSLYRGDTYTDVFLTSFETNSSILKADVEVLAANNKKLFSGQTDETGRVRIETARLTGSGGLKPEFLVAKTAGSDMSVMQLSDLDTKPRLLENGIKKQHADDIYLTTDRDIFRTGETINIFGVARTRELAAISDKDYRLELVRSDGEVILHKIVRTSKNGVFLDNFKINPAARLGRYSLKTKSIDGTILASHTVRIDDFVPLTIEPKVTSENAVWTLNQKQKLTLAAEYFSGGAAALLNGELRVRVVPAEFFESREYSEYSFGSLGQARQQQVETFELTLDERGLADAELTSSFELEKNRLYRVIVDGSVLDVGGRPNRTRLEIPLDTEHAYVGVYSLFGEQIDEGDVPSFKVAHLDRLGNRVPIDGLSYRVVKIHYRYNWYENDGWRWRRVKVGETVVESGKVDRENLTFKSALDWGLYELEVTNRAGFKTVIGFNSGWGADQKPVSEPEELSLAFERQSQRTGTLKFDAPFSGKLRLLNSSSDILSVQDFDISQGQNSVKVSLVSGLEPGSHLLATLMRPIEEGSEHLPQLAVGAKWIETISKNRRPMVTIDAPEQLGSDEKITVSVKIDSKVGTAFFFLVDEGLHAVTGYKNEDMVDYFLGSREPSLGLQTNFGKLILQDKSLDLYKVGGGDDLASQLSVERSEFFKTFSMLSKPVNLENGTGSFTFSAANMEGKLRLVVMVVTEHGFGFEEREIRVQDPVSLDISLPRFIAPGDNIYGKFVARSNDYSGSVEMKIRLGKNLIEDNFSIEPNGKMAKPLSFDYGNTGRLPVKIEAQYDGKKIKRDYELVSRLPSYPYTEVLSVDLSDPNWLDRSLTSVPPLESDAFKYFEGDDIDVSLNLSVGFGANLSQILSSLDRYPYGCIEQTSSTTRGLLARADGLGVDRDLKAKINSGIDRIIAKQKASGAFGYWSRKSFVYERYQPYAIETLIQALPYASDREKSVKAINAGLEYLYRTDLSDPIVQLHAYGLLADAGYEVTSRARYTIDYELGLASYNDTMKAAAGSALEDKLDELTLAYWVASKLNDSERLEKISFFIQKFLEATDVLLEPRELQEGIWLASTAAGSGSYSYPDQIVERATAPNFAYLLADLREPYQSDLSRIIIQRTKSYLGSKQSRSTIENARLLTLFNSQKNAVQIGELLINGDEFPVARDGSIDVPASLLGEGFELRYSADVPLVLNASITGRRQTIQPVDNGFKIQKYWYASDGKPIDLTNGVLEARQGDLFTVLLDIQATHDTQNDDMLLTDLLPSGFEIEDSLISPPREFFEDGGFIYLDLDAGKKPVLVQKLDDRIISHFQGSWQYSSHAVLAYTVRAAYTGEMTIPDAHAEHMYAPEISGRSSVTRAIVRER